MPAAGRAQPIVLRPLTPRALAARYRSQKSRTAIRQWAFSKTFAFATELRLLGLPRKSHVAVLCRGGGCPFVKRTFAARKHGKLDVASALKQRHLSVGSTVDLQISATNTVGEVVRFTVVAGKLPKESFLCLAPGDRAPSACAS